MRTGLLLVCMIVLIGVHLHALSAASREQGLRHGEEVRRQLVPTALLQLTSFEHRGLVSDFLFLEALVHYGKTLERDESPRIKDWEWPWIEGMLAASTDLDSYFYDPYYFGNAIMTWEGKRFQKANLLLDKGITARVWDWRLPFFAGFNAYYFMNDNEQAARYFMESSRRPDVSPMIATLAVRMANRASRTESALLFIGEMLMTIHDSTIRDELLRRQEMLKGVWMIEKARDQFLRTMNRNPLNLEEIIQAGLLKVVPRDPFGGKYIVDSSGNVKSTSDMYYRKDTIPHLLRRPQQ